MSSSIPRVFVSATSRDLGEVRSAIAGMLVTMGCLPVEQTKFPPDYRSVREMLRNKIRACDAVIHVVGRRYGAEPDPAKLPPGMQRRSYTQMEYDLAREMNKKLFTFVCGEGFPYSDMGVAPEPAELAALQDAHRQAVMSDDRLRYQVQHREELDDRIRELQIRLEEVIEQNRAFRRRVTAAVIAAALLLLLGGTAIWFRLSRIDTAMAPLQSDVHQTARVTQETHQTVGEIQNATTQTREGVAKLNATMTASAAQSALNDAAAAKDGSLSGQIEAIQTLIALGHTFTGKDLSGISFKAARLPGANFSGGKLHAIDLSQVQAPGADFSEAGLRFARLDEGQFPAAKFVKSYGPFVWARKTAFNDADLSECNFIGGDFQDADFRGAKLRGACLAFADLRRARFDGADLTGAYLIGAMLDGASFVNTTISETDVYGVCAGAFPFSAAQAKGLCRPAVHVLENGLKIDKPMMRWDVRALEQWKSDRYDTGYEFFDLNIPSGWMLGDFCDPNLPPRPAEPKEGPPAFYVDFPAEMTIHLDRDYLEKSGRRRQFVQRINQHRELLLEQLKPERMLKLP